LDTERLSSIVYSSLLLQNLNLSHPSKAINMASMDYENENGTRGYEGQAYPMIANPCMPDLYTRKYF
jgi:hypothetical protein